MHDAFPVILFSVLDGFICTVFFLPSIYLRRVTACFTKLCYYLSLPTQAYSCSLLYSDLE